jgi:hypothetical protein
MAELAKNLDRAADAPKTVAGWLTERIARWLGRSSLERQLAKKIMEQFIEKADVLALWPAMKFKLVARFMRICGMWTCVDGGLDLRGCECFKGLAENVTKDYLKGILEAKLAQIV